MRYLSEREQKEAALHLQITDACAEIQQATAAGKMPDFAKLNDLHAQLKAIKQQDHILVCADCKENFVKGSRPHYTVIIYQLIDPQGKIIADIPSGVLRLAYCGNCWDKKDLNSYIKAR